MTSAGFISGICWLVMILACSTFHAPNSSFFTPLKGYLPLDLPRYCRSQWRPNILAMDINLSIGWSFTTLAAFWYGETRVVGDSSLWRGSWAWENPGRKSWSNPTYWRELSYSTFCTRSVKWTPFFWGGRAWLCDLHSTLSKHVWKPSDLGKVDLLESRNSKHPFAQRAFKFFCGRSNDE